MPLRRRKSRKASDSRGRHWPLFLVVAGQGTLATLARDPFCQTDAPAVYATLATRVPVASPYVTEIIRAG